MGLAGKPSRTRSPALNGSAAGKADRLPQQISVLLVDARRWTREALVRAFESAGEDLKVLCFDEATDLARADVQRGAALVLLNITGSAPSDPRVLAAATAARMCLPNLPVAVLSDNASAAEILVAIRHGLSGYIPISLELGYAIEVLRFVAAGGLFVPAEVLLACLDSDDAIAIHPPEQRTPAPEQIAAPAIPVMEDLTPRERAVLQRLRQGKSNKHIARELDMSEATVKVHVRHIMRKVGATNRTQVALLAEDVMKGSGSDGE
ncbi:MAG: LuxR C-terminal-related transcriptional regulator [Gammaproteobacteria bacterium]